LRNKASAELALRPAGGEPPPVTLKPWLAKGADRTHDNASAELALRPAGGVCIVDRNVGESE